MTMEETSQTEWDEDGRLGRELYDHAIDRGELTNLVGDPAHASTVSDLRDQLHSAVQNSFPADGQTLPPIESTPSPTLTREK